MKILYSPQVSEKTINYSFENETITAELNGITQSFPLSFIETELALISKMANDEEMFYFADNEGNPLQNCLDVTPICKAYRDEENNLCVELLNFISENATEEEKYPQWVSV